MNKSELLNAIFVINQEVETLYKLTKTLNESKCFKSESARAFTAGSEFAYNNVLKLICDKLNKIGK